MPEAAVDEDGDSQAREDDVWTHANLRERNREVLSEAQAAPVQLAPDSPLRASVGATVSLHGPADTGAYRGG
jgi:hypothetical protein